MLRTCSSCKLRSTFGKYFEGAVTGALGGAAFNATHWRNQRQSQLLITISAPLAACGNGAALLLVCGEWQCLCSEGGVSQYSTELNGEIKQGDVQVWRFFRNYVLR